MAVYYVDPTNGDNDNDGLTPDAAKADIFIGNTDPNDIPIFWIKRGEEIEITDVQEINYAIVRSWATSSDPLFDDRPQEGIDAGWDSDSTPPAKFFCQTESINYFNVTDADSSVLEFNDIDFEIKATGAIVFNQASARITLNNCRVYGDGPGAVLFKYYGTSSSKNLDNGVVSFIDSSFINESPDTANWFFVQFDGNNKSYKSDIVIDNSKLLGIYTLMYAPNAKYSIYTMHITIKKSYLNFSYYMYRVSSYERAYNQTIYFDIEDSNISSDSDTFLTSESSEACCYNFHLKSKNTNYRSGRYFINDYHSSTSTSNYNYIPNIEIIGGVIEAQRMYNNYAYNKTRVGHWNFEDVEFKNMGIAFYFYGLYSVSSFIVKNPIMNEVDKFIVVETSYCSRENFNISMIGQSIAGGLISGSGGGEIYIEDCSIGKYLVHSDTQNSNIVAINSDFDSIQGTGHTVNIRSCRLESSTGPALGECDGEVYDTQIISGYDNLLTEKSSVSFNRCNITSKGFNEPKTHTSFKFVNCVLNGEPTPLYEVFGDLRKKSSPIYRVNGNPYSLMIEVRPKDVYTRAIVGDVYCAHIAAKPNITVYFNSVSSLVENSAINLKASFVSDGVLKVIPITIEADASSQWDGVQAENNPYRGSVDLSDFAISEGSKISILFSLSNLAGENPTIHIDTKLGQE